MDALDFDARGFRLFKKLDKNVQRALIERIDKLKGEPNAGEPLRGSLRAYRSLHFGFKGTQYRVIYKVEGPPTKILVVLADKRENIYKRLVEMQV